jgi:hypothetical protein
MINHGGLAAVGWDSWHRGGGPPNPPILRTGQTEGARRLLGEAGKRSDPIRPRFVIVWMFQDAPST